MSKSNPLTSKDMLRYALRPEVYGLIGEFSALWGIHPGGMRILDWGCGRGRSVAWLRDKGFEAYGVDVDDGPMRNAEAYFQERGMDPAGALRLLENGYKTPFSEGFFHIIYSEQVFEHVRDIRAIAGELSRLMREGAIGFHRFPGHLRIVEPHLFMPFIHWLPKNGSRRLLAFAWVLLRVEPRWKELKGSSPWKKAGAYAKYTIHKTFYRNPAELSKIFAEAGFKVDFRSARFSRQIETLPARFPALRRFFQWMLTTFLTVEMTIERIQR